MRRTVQQQRAIEVYCREVANTLNDGGFDLKAVLEKKAIPVPCTQENIKDNVFKKIENALWPDKTSTTELTTGEVTEVYEVMNKWLGEQFGIHVEFPHEEE